MPRVKEVQVGLGISLEVKGTWYRPNATITIELDEADSKATRKKAFQQAWQEVEEQVEKQIATLLKE